MVTSKRAQVDLFTFVDPSFSELGRPTSIENVYGWSNGKLVLSVSWHAFVLPIGAIRECAYEQSANYCRTNYSCQIKNFDICIWVGGTGAGSADRLQAQLCGKRWGATKIVTALSTEIVKATDPS
jgi:hypothetical protein